MLLWWARPRIQCIVSSAALSAAAYLVLHRDHWREQEAADTFEHNRLDCVAHVGDCVFSDFVHLQLERALRLIDGGRGEQLRRKHWQRTIRHEYSRGSEVVHTCRYPGRR